MATEYGMPVQQFTASPTQSQYTLYNSQSQQTSPINSANATPKGSSPTSPRSSTLSNISQPTRQLRPLKSPMYVPAVLRPTDPPRKAARQSPLTPPDSKHSSYDDLDDARSLKRRSTADSGKFGLGEIQEVEDRIEGLGKVTGFPTRDHWKPDAETTICDETTCPKYFSYFNRRHHCRKCGNIFCDTHSSYSVPLDQNAEYHPKGTRTRSCEHCFLGYRRWAITRSSASNSDTSEDSQIPRTPVVECKGKGALAGIFAKDGGIAQSLAQSVPRDWNWSTF